MTRPAWLRSPHAIELAIVATVLLLLGAGAAVAFNAGRALGQVEGPKRERAEQLRRLQQDIIERDRARQLRDARLAQERADLEIGRQAVAAAAAKHAQLRARVQLVDSSSAIVDGILEQLPVPVVQLTQAADARIRVDSLQQLKLEAHVATLEEQLALLGDQVRDATKRGELLEAELHDERRLGRWGKVKAAGAGAAGGYLLAKVLELVL